MSKCDTCSSPILEERVRQKTLPCVKRVGPHHVHVGLIYDIYGTCKGHHLTWLRKGLVKWDACHRCQRNEYTVQRSMTPPPPPLPPKTPPARL